MSDLILNTKQEYFDFCYQAIMKQGCASVNEYGEGRYYGPDELKCAVGHFISEKEYDHKIEGASVIKLLAFDFMKKHINFIFLLREFQRAHDDLRHINKNNKVEFRQKFHDKMINVAFHYGLIPPKIAPEYLKS